MIGEDIEDYFYEDKDWFGVNWLVLFLLVMIDWSYRNGNIGEWGGELILIVNMNFFE